MKEFPKLFSIEGQEEVGELVAKQKNLHAELQIYVKETNYGYMIRNIEFLKKPAQLLINIIIFILKVLPLTKEFAEELSESKEYYKHNITTGSASLAHYSKEKYSKKDAILHHVSKMNRTYKKVNLRIV